MVALALVGLAVACGGPDDAAAPTEEEIQVLTQVMLLEGALQDYSGATRDSLAVLYYDQLYDRFGIDARWLDDMRDRFDRDVRLWEEATDSVDARLTRHRLDLGPLLHTGFTPR